MRRAQRSSRVVLLLAVSALLALTASSPAQAAKRRVPFGFFGVVGSGINQSEVSDATLAQQMAQMASSGVEIVRQTYDWGMLEPEEGVYNWAPADRLIAAAARQRIQVLFNIFGSADWASSKPKSEYEEDYPPKNPNTFAEFMRQAVLRYGPHGSFWAQNPSLPRDPIREWQIWNEESARFFWIPSPWAPGYARLLKPTYLAIHHADSGAKVVAGSFVGAPESPWDDASDLYRAGGKRYFDMISVHPFTNNPKSATNSAQRVLEIVQKVRAVMNAHGDRRKPIIITEVTWTAALGHVPRAALLGFEATPKGQAARLQATYRQVAAARRKMNITQVYWFSWATPYVPNGAVSNETFLFSGLNRITNGIFTRLPLLTAYANVAARLEGCRKSTIATTCR